MPSLEETAPTLVGAPRAEAYCGACNRSFQEGEAVCPYDGTKLVQFGPSVDPLLGRVLDGRYQIESRLGEGGMGAVYRARQLSVDRLVAIKVVHPQISADREIAKRFLREARLASSLNAPGIVSVFEFGQTGDGVLYLVMELIEGTSLERVAKRGRQSASRVVQIGLQLCDALEVAHAAGIVHRDLKPANIIVHETPTGPVVKVLDFGIAKVMDTPSITSTRAAVGTPLYMAPEQFDGHATARSDLYSLGCVLYELATGAPPFTANDLATLVARHMTQQPAPLPPELAPDIAGAILRLLAKRPDDRFASAAELREELIHAQVSQVVSAPIIRTQITPIPRLPTHTPTPTPTTPFVDAATMPEVPRRTRRPGVVLIGVALVVAAVVGYVVVRGNDTAGRPSVAAPAPTPAPPAAPAPTPAAVAAPVSTPAVPAPAQVTPAPLPAPAPTPPAPVTKPAATTKPHPAKRPPATKKKPAASSGDTDLPFAPAE